MTKFNLPFVKDLGLQREVMDALPYAVVGGAWKGTFTGPVTEAVLLSHIVPAGLQLKVLFLRVWTQEAGGAVFSIFQFNPTALGQTGTGVGAVEAFPVVGSVPSGYRDYPMLEAPGSEKNHSGLRDPIHVLEGSITFRVQHTPTPATGAYYGISWWGVQKIPE